MNSSAQVTFFRSSNCRSLQKGAPEIGGLHKECHVGCNGGAAHCRIHEVWPFVDALHSTHTSVQICQGSTNATLKQTRFAEMAECLFGCILSLNLAQRYRVASLTHLYSSRDVSVQQFAHMGQSQFRAVLKSPPNWANKPTLKRLSRPQKHKRQKMR